MALIKLVGKTFAVCQKSTKTAKVFFLVGFVVYSVAHVMLLKYKNACDIYTAYALILSGSNIENQN